MKNEKFFTDQTQQKSLGAEMETSFMLDLYVQMVIDEALFKRKKSLLEEKIDKALDARNKDEFLQLTKQYKELMRSHS